MKIIKIFRIGPIMNNAFLIHLEKENKYILIDAPFNSEKIIQYLKKNDIKLNEIWITHAHYDHIAGLNTLKEYDETIKVYVAKEEQQFLKEPENNLSNTTEVEIIYKYESYPLEDNKLLYNANEFNDLNQNIVYKNIAGHSYLSTIFIFQNEKIMFSGDVIFKNTIGRSDFKFGNFENLTKGIKEKIYSYEDDYTIYSGHGFKTYLKDEKMNNPYIRMEN